jgi:exopolyphosphatase / guanosine-5'-triphosphate,3'-diphosphate pyrophosphatase
MMVGIIDLGTNSSRISIYQIKDERLSLYVTKKESLGLGNYVNKNNALGKEGFDAMIKSIERFVNFSDKFNVEKLFIVGTAVFRNIKNSKLIIQKAQKILKLKIDLITGEEEAKYGFEGVMQVNKAKSGITLDIGGGSFEIVHFIDRKVESALAFPVGSLNSFIGNVKHLLPTKKETKEIERKVEKLMKNVNFKANKDYLIYGIGGTIRNSVKINNEINGLKPSNNIIEYSQLKKLINNIVEDDKKTLLTIIKNAPDRIHTITPGLVILKAVAKHFNLKIIDSQAYGLREGYVYKNFVLKQTKKLVGKNGKKRN